MPPKGWKKKKAAEETKEKKVKVEVKEKKPPKRTRTKKVKDDLGPTTKSPKDDSTYAKVVVVWRDAKGRERTTSYTMADLTLNEGVTEVFNGAKKATRIHLSLDGAVLKKV